MKYISIQGFKDNETKVNFLQEYIGRVKNPEKHNLDIVIGLAIDSASQQINEENDSADYELSSHETLSGHTETMAIHLDQLEHEWLEDE